jgi:hypothetical protein
MRGMKKRWCLVARLPATRFTSFGSDLSPNFYLQISGKDTSKAAPLFDAIRPYIESISFEEDEEMASMLEINLINKSRDELDTKADFRAVLNNKAFQEGNFIDIWIGYEGLALDYKGRVEIVKWLPNFPADGPITFTIKGYDGRHKMTKSNQFKVKQSGKARRRKTFYKGLTDDKIVKKIAAKYGYGADTDIPETKRRQVTTIVNKQPKTKSVVPTRVQPSDMNDWAFLKKLANINRFDLWVAYDQSKKQFVVNFKKRPDATSAIFKFEYQQGLGSLIEAQPDFSIQDQPTDVEVLYFDKKKRTIERTVISDSSRAEVVKLTSAGVGNLEVKKEIGRGASVRFTAFGQQIEVFADRPFASKSEATTFVQNYLKDREDDFLLLRGKVVGVESLSPRQVHECVGMSTRLDGFYRFTQVKHVQGPGEIYSCDILANKVLSQPLTRRKATTKVQTKATPQQA